MLQNFRNAQSSSLQLEVREDPPLRKAEEALR
jgi:hypothetical protein